MLASNQVIGHRGAAAYAPENTIASFEQAKRMGCRWVEFDVMLSSDNEPYVFHDHHLHRTTNGRGKFSEKSSDYLQSLDAGIRFSKRFRGEKIPHFDDVLNWLIHADMHANIEIKATVENLEKTSMIIVNRIKQLWPIEKTLPIISSFQHDALKLCHNVAPEFPLGILLDKWQDDWLMLARSMNCFSIHISQAIATAKRIIEIKSQGYNVYVYTVNSKRRATHLFGLGVDGVFSDRPDLMFRQFNFTKMIKKWFEKEIS